MESLGVYNKVVHSEKTYVGHEVGEEMAFKFSVRSPKLAQRERMVDGLN